MCKIVVISHTKLDRRKGSYLCDVTATTLWPSKTSSFDFTHKNEKKLSRYILEIQNFFFF